MADTPGSVEAPEDVAGDWGADGGGGMDVGGIDVGKDGSVIGVKVGGLTSRTDDEDDETDTGEDLRVMCPHESVVLWLCFAVLCSVRTSHDLGRDRRG